MKVLVLKGKKENVEGVGIVTTVKQRIFYADEGKDFHTNYGKLSKEKLKKGGKAASDTGKQFYVFDAGFTDKLKRLKRSPQSIPLKDLGFIAAETGIDKSSVVVEAGLGSGISAIFFSRLAKKIVSYEVDNENIEVAKANIKTIGAKNITIIQKNFYDSCNEKNANLVLLDVPEPWNAVASAVKAAAVGGFIVSYSPQLTQSQKFACAMEKYENILLLKTVEIIERPWIVEEKRLRPATMAIAHSGFITFARRIA